MTHGFDPQNGSGPLGVAIIGAGLMGRWHAAAARRMGARVCGIVDSDLGRAKRLAAQAGTRAYADFDQMLGPARPDVVHICSPTRTHGQFIDAAIKAGLHVFAEKPLVDDLAQTRDVLGAAERAGVQICPVHQYAFQPVFERVPATLAKLGDLIDIELKFYSAGGANVPLERHAELAADILPHPISILQRVLPECDLAALDWRIDGLGSQNWHLMAAAGPTQLRIVLSLAARPTCAQMRVSGRRAGLYADLFHGFSVISDGTPGRRNKILQPFSQSVQRFSQAAFNLTGRVVRREPAYPGLRPLTGAFYAACRGTGAAPISAAQILQGAAVRDLFVSQTRADAP